MVGPDNCGCCNSAASNEFEGLCRVAYVDSQPDCASHAKRIFVDVADVQYRTGEQLGSKYTQKLDNTDEMGSGSHVKYCF